MKTRDAKAKLLYARIITTSSNNDLFKVLLHRLETEKVNEQSQ